MYDRASRNLSKPLNNTLETVGPGSYEQRSFLQGRNRVGYAPFGSMTGRETFFDVNDQTMAAPGPGQYNPLLNHFEKVKGGQSLANKSKRFDATSKNIPGPGSYNLTKTSDWIKEQPCKPFSQEENLGTKHNIIFFRKVDPPSIPSPGKSYGYEEANDGSLKPQKMPDKDFTMGPAYYNVDHRETNTTRSYKGVFFGKKDSKRFNFRGNSSVPGPGAYYPSQPQEPKCPMELILEENSKRLFEAKIPRYHELVTKEQEKKAVPAPGHYQIKSQFEQIDVTQDDHTALVAPFGSQARRFGDSSNNFPSPGSYNDPRTAFESLKRIKGIKGSPFGQTSIRFHGNERNKSLPGPGSYNVPDEVSSMIRKNMMSGGSKKVPFGSTSVRTVPLTRTHEDLYPGPARYTNTENTPKRYVQPSSTFASASDRLHSPPPIVKEVPPPGSYEVRKSYDTTQGRVLYSYSQKKNRNSRKKGGFLSSSSRFKESNSQAQRGTTPGPGQYEAPVYQPKQGGLMVTKDARFKTQKSDVPGPGNYELSPQFAHSVLKGTFNATLNNPMIKANFEESDTKLSSSPRQEITLTSIN